MVYQQTCCERGQMENFIKGYKTHLAADRTSCRKPGANRFPLFLHLGADWLMWAFRQAAPKRSSWAKPQFDTIRLRLFKTAARVEELKTVIRLHLPATCPVARPLRMFAATRRRQPTRPTPGPETRRPATRRRTGRLARTARSKLHNPTKDPQTRADRHAPTHWLKNSETSSPHHTDPVHKAG